MIKISRAKLQAFPPAGFHCHWYSWQVDHTQLCFKAAKSVSSRKWPLNEVGK